MANLVDHALDKATLRLRQIKDLLAWQRRQPAADLWAEVAILEELFSGVREAAMAGSLHVEAARKLLRERMEAPRETPLGEEIDGGSEA